MSQLKSVAVIGGGAAGLCAARHLFHYNKGFLLKPVVFEQKDVIGGTWVYEDIDRNKPKEVFSSLYLNMRTNLPKQVMLFPDFPYPDDLPSYMHHTDVRKYLNDYADHYGLVDFVRFNTEVVNVSPILDAGLNINDTSDNRFVKWNVKSKDKITKETVIEEYDAVVVCNGHYSEPMYPSIVGLNNFAGELMHSHYYRRPSDFIGKDVLLLGCGPSALDIMGELSKTCRMVYLSHRGAKISSKHPENIIELPNICNVNEDGDFVFEDSSSVRVDTFIMCTGYSLSFPFLSSESGIVVEDNCVKNLYRHIFCINYSSLSFAGLTWKNSPFPGIHQQCAYIASILSEVKQLPSPQDMLKDTENERIKRLDLGELPKYFHRMGDFQWSYNRDIANLAGNAENPPVIENLYKYAMTVRKADVGNYKNTNYCVLSDTEFNNI